MVSVDKDKCIGCGACESICGSVFKLVDGKSTVIEGADTNASCVKEAVDACPVKAISVE